VAGPAPCLLAGRKNKARGERAFFTFVSADLGGGFSLRAENFALGLEPVLAVMAVFAAAGFVEFVGAESDFFLQFSRIENCASWFGALVSDFGSFAAGPE